MLPDPPIRGVREDATRQEVRRMDRWQVVRGIWNGEMGDKARQSPPVDLFLEPKMAAKRILRYITVQ